MKGADAKMSRSRGQFQSLLCSQPELDKQVDRSSRERVTEIAVTSTLVRKGEVARCGAAGTRRYQATIPMIPCAGGTLYPQFDSASVLIIKLSRGLQCRLSGVGLDIIQYPYGKC